MSTDRRAIRNQLRRAAAALREHWDPVGGGEVPDLPADEYEAYAPGVVTLLRSGADDLRIAAHLCALEREDMGLTPPAPERLLPVVRAIRHAVGG